MMSNIDIAVGKDGKRAQLVKDFAEVINRHSRENGSNTPDFILAEFLVSTLEAYEHLNRTRVRWFMPLSQSVAEALDPEKYDKADRARWEEQLKTTRD